MDKLKVLFAATECYPFAKSGGLGDVIGALPKAFPKDQADVRVILPKYDCIPEKYFPGIQDGGHLLCAHRQ